MKPGPKSFAILLNVMKRAKRVELDELEVAVVEVQGKAAGKRNIGRPRKPRHPIEQVAEAATMNTPRFWESIQSMRGLSIVEVEAANAILMFSYHAAFLVDIVLQLRMIQ
jgi:hypothetical protein